MDLVPTGSHVAILSLIATMAVCLICTFLFIWKGINYWPPLIFSFLLLAVIVVFWLLSHRHVDDKSMPPTTLSVKDGDSSTTLSIPSRGLSPIQYMELLSNAISAVLHREPLPEPDGLVDKEGNPILKSKREALARVKALNSQVREATDALRARKSDSEVQGKVAQSKLTVEPRLEEIGEINKPSESVSESSSKESNTD